MLNIHHLELFYYVAKHQGVSAAARNMPYGIQQPAISGQILMLEDYLGGPLFQRRPFSLTHAGEELYTYIKPFFDGLEGIEEKVRGGAEKGGARLTVRGRRVLRLYRRMQREARRAIAASSRKMLDEI